MSIVAANRSGSTLSLAKLPQNYTRAGLGMLQGIVFDNKGVVCTYTGRSSLQEVLDAARQYLTHPECSAFSYIVHDFTDVGSFLYSESEFAGLANYAIENYQEADHVARCAVTVDDTVKRCLELYGVITGRKWSFVLTLSAAREWAKER